MTQKKYDQKNYQSLISCAEDFRARLFQLLEKDKVLKMPEELYSLKLPDWLKQDDLRIFYLKMYPDCYRITKARRLTPSYIRFMDWGIMWNGKCLTARISESLSPEKECILSDILMKDVPENITFHRSKQEGSCSNRPRLPGEQSLFQRRIKLYYHFHRRRDGRKNRAL